MKRNCLWSSPKRQSHFERNHRRSIYAHVDPPTMAFLKQCIQRPPTTASLNENDDIYPVHTLDDTKTLRRLFLAWTICFNDALDAHKLRCALAKLLDIGDWRKVGGRLALKVRHSFRVSVEKTDDLE
jgi:hypothetical protein